MQRARHLALGLVLALLVHSCGAEEPPTEIVVAIDSDLDLPNEADHLQVLAVDEKGKQFEFNKPLAAGTLPLTLGLTSGNDDARALTLTAMMWNGDTIALERVMGVHFVPHESRFAPLTLCGLCRGVTCKDGEVCGEGGCEKRDRDELAPFTGTIPPRACGGCKPGQPRVPFRAFDVSKPGWPHTCNVENVLARDDLVAGLDYAEGSAVKDELSRSLGTVGGTSVAGCVAVDFGAVTSLDPIVVRARAVRDENGSACGPPTCTQTNAQVNCEKCCQQCSNAVQAEGSGTPTCELGGTLYVFAGAALGAYTRIGSKTLTNDLRDETFSFSDPKVARYVVVCRAADGPAAADVAVDAIWSNATCP